MKLLLMAFASLFMINSQLQAATDKLIAESGEYFLFIRTEDDGQSAVAILGKKQEGSEILKIVDTSEDVQGLIKKNVTDSVTAKALTEQVAKAN